MIEINLLPGARKGKRSRGAAIDFRSLFANIGERVRDPWLATAVVGVALGITATGFMYWRTSAREKALIETERTAVADSTRFASVLREMTTATAQRDSLTLQIRVITAIDRSRYVWPHVMEEVSRALPPYTWLRSMQQTSAVPAVSPEVEVGVSKAAGGKSAAAAQAEAEEAAAASAVSMRLVGQTVDIQALTRFVRQLEDSPWLENVTLARTENVLAQPANKEVTEFTIEMRISRPDSTHIRRVPLTVGVR
jgi:Tfp pilus assembly protein PilN